MEYIGTIFVAVICFVLGYIWSVIHQQKEDANNVEFGKHLERETALDIVNRNIDRAAKCMDEATGYEEYPYWDGAHDMANAIRREIEKEEQKDE